jgi:hypothetical protein
MQEARQLRFQTKPCLEGAAKTSDPTPAENVPAEALRYLTRAAELEGSIDRDIES